MIKLRNNVYDSDHLSVIDWWTGMSPTDNVMLYYVLLFNKQTKSVYLISANSLYVSELDFDDIRDYMPHIQSSLMAQAYNTLCCFDYELVCGDHIEYCNDASPVESCVVVKECGYGLYNIQNEFGFVVPFVPRRKLMLSEHGRLVKAYAMVNPISDLDRENILKIYPEVLRFV